MDLENNKDSQPLRSISNDQTHKLKRRRCIIYCSSITGIILTISLILLILGLTVFKAKKPIITVNSVQLNDFDVSVNPIPVRVSLNLSLALDISIKNPNKVTVKYGSSSAALRYRGEDVGNVPIPAGTMGSDDTSRLNLTLTVFADKLVSDTDVYGDVLKGSLPLTTYTRIKAKVRVLFVHIHVTSTSSCDLNINVGSGSISNQTCHSKNKI